MFSLVVRAFVSLLAFDSLAVGNHQKEDRKVYDPPCFFNPLCTCSKSFPDLGRVTCENIPLLTIPQQLNTSKVFMLHMENNGLRYVEPQFFRHTGLFRIEISQNSLTEIREETFAGLERTLWELKLKRNKLRRVPNQSFRHLQKLKLLDLSDNVIASVGAEDWSGLENSLKTLILSGNKLSTLRPRVFSMLRQLESLDLSGNALFEFDAMAFKDGPAQLNELLLADNLLVRIPFQELSELRELRHLDLSFNQITEVQDLSFERSKVKQANLVLDTLRLDYNQIRYLRGESFKSFPTLNRTYLNGNPVASLEKDAFRRCKIRELYLRDCDISELTIDSLSGLQGSLQVLDLEGNNLTGLPLYFFKEFHQLKSLKLKDNFFKEIDSDKMFDGYGPSLERLDLGGQQNPIVHLQNLDMLHNLRSLSLSRLSQPSLSAKDLPEFLIELEEMKISHSNIKILKSHAFKNVRGLRRLDLSENSISTIEDKAFSEVGHSLMELSLANGLSSSLAQMPARIFDELTSVEFLDLSDNGIKTLPKKLFYSMKQLRTLWAQDNFIESIPKRTFQGDIHPELNTIQFSFNQLSSIESQSFVGLSKLEYLWLSDNKISTIEKRAFVDLDRLKFLYLRGNKINLLKEEAFQDLPQLEHLDLAYNRLRSFNYACLEQVGTLSSFSLNLSRNSIQELITNSSDHPHFAVLPVNIKALDLSHNNISRIGPGFFRPVESSLTHLYLSRNRLRNVSRAVFGGMRHLQWLDLSNNFLADLEHDALADTKNIQVLYLSKNYLQEIPRNFLKGFHRLRILSLESNELRSLPDNLFADGTIERLDVSNNQLTRIPVSCFDSDSASRLLELDLSENAIVTLPSAQAFAIFKNLYWLNLSKNRVIRVEDGTFSFLRRLHVLDLSHNSDLNLDLRERTFYGLDLLEDLVLKNLSLNAIPALRLPSLTSLDVSDNDIAGIPFEFSHNLSQLERLELSGNELVAVPPAINTLTKLRYLGVSRNPLESINFQQSYSVREVDLANISLGLMEKGALGKMPLLESVRLTINQNVDDLNLPQILKHNYGLNHLCIEVLESEGSSLGDEMSGIFPPKLRNLTLFGRGLKAIPRNLLEGIQSPRLNLVIFNTSVQEIREEVFDNAKNIRNLTLDLRSNKLRTVFNPNTGSSPNAPGKMFLLGLKISDNDWNCDCAIGWIEGWERKRRQHLCGDESEECLLGPDGLRAAVCANRKPATLLEVFKTDLECGWNSADKLGASAFLSFSAAIPLLRLVA